MPLPPPFRPVPDPAPGRDAAAPARPLHRVVPRWRSALPLVLPLLVLGALARPPRIAADDDAKDRRIRELEDEVTRLKAEVARLRAELDQARAGGAASPLPVPDATRMNAGQETSREQLKFLHYLAKSHRPKAGEPQWPALDGKNFVLWLVAVGLLERDNEGPLKMLFSPADRALPFPGTAPYAEVTLAALTQRRFPRLTSYAGRRNAAPGLAITPQSPPATTALFADLSFGDGALVAFLDGKVRYLNRRDLGLSPTDPLVAGAASKSPLLQTLSSD